MVNQEILKGAKAIAEALDGPGGPIKLAKIIPRHLPWFESAVARGMSWDQIIKVLAAAGANRADGLPFSRGHVSSAVWRAQKRAAALSKNGPATRGYHGKTAETKKHRKSTANKGQTAAKLGRRPGLSPSSTVSTAQPTARLTESSVRPAESGDLRGFMRRAAQMRGRQIVDDG